LIITDRLVSYYKTTLAGLTDDASLVPVLTVNNWILVQNKVPWGSNTASFNQSWISYRNGFGSPSLTDNYWIGNEKIYHLTNLSGLPYKLRIEVRLSLCQNLVDINPPVVQGGKLTPQADLLLLRRNR
jgi:Fibrinogen beta and gamma chains, C-terminal globular domain